MKEPIFIILFILGGLFLNASHIPAWWLGAGKPTHQYWKIYGLIGLGIYFLMFVLANSTL